MKGLLITLFLITPFITFAQFRGGLGADYLNTMGDFATNGASFNIAAMGEHENSRQFQLGSKLE